jgi:VWFA-related protein
MRTIVVLSLLLAPPLFAQFRETVDVRVLELDVVAVDRNGHPADGLTRADFDVQIGNRRAEVSNFYAVKRGALVDEQSSGARPSTIAPETRMPVSLVILIDDTRLTVRGKQRAMEALREYIKENVGTNTTAMLARFNGSLDVRTRPTERPGMLLAELDRMAEEPGQFSESERRGTIKEVDDALTGVTSSTRAHRLEQAWQQVVLYAERESHIIERSIDGIRAAIRLAAAFDGRKSVLYVSEGLPMMAGADLFDYWDRAMKAVDAETNGMLQEEVGLKISRSLDPLQYDRSRSYDRLAKYAQNENVALYGIDAGGLRGFERSGAEDRKTIGRISTILAQSNRTDALRFVANETGGKFITAENDLGRALTVISEQFTTYYSLGVRAPASTKLERVRVTVKNRPELRVITARHRKPLSREQELERTVRARLYNQRTENPLRAKFAFAPAAPIDSRCVVRMELSVPPEKASQMLDLYFALLDDRQQESDVRASSMAGEDHAVSIGVKPGKYVLSLALASRASGETTYVQRDIDATGCK